MIHMISKFVAMSIVVKFLENLKGSNVLIILVVLLFVLLFMF
jgi:hypothetical protein